MNEWKFEEPVFFDDVQRDPTREKEEDVESRGGRFKELLTRQQVGRGESRTAEPQNRRYNNDAFPSCFYFSSNKGSVCAGNRG
jgi:hypothetical protein